ncbi:hypothetical protein C2R22_18450 [Salinigranum rubrum]|uniref:Uncharacterized protein n=1 Tax=Salinigranum rubrum TaxID=755307 RepID=A0A2I8VN66_9EURY|nr:hypothetical protein [Salinigranum rubrum]AUV83380.1 hypothetical protein C2R22_18450 [Salinigranum rubrum]
MTNSGAGLILVVGFLVAAVAAVPLSVLALRHRTGTGIGHRVRKEQPQSSEEREERRNGGCAGVEQTGRRDGRHGH